MDLQEECKKNIKFIHNKKYKSTLPTFIGFDQIIKQLPQDQKAIHTLKYLYFKFGSGIFVQIKDNKLYKYAPFINDKFRNEFSNLIKTDDIIKYYENKGFSGPYLKRLIRDKRRWKANNCLIKVLYDLNVGESHSVEMKDMLENLLKSHKIKNCCFFINRKDFPILKKNGTEPYNHIFGDNQPLLSYKYDKYSPIFGMSNRDDLYADILLPTYDCWYMITKKFFPPECKNNYIFDDKKISWSKKKSIAVFRGSATGCFVDINKNPRLLLSKINIEWNRGNKKGWIDAGVTRDVTKDKKNLDSQYLQHSDIKKLGIEPVKPISMEDQKYYKYVFDIEGNSAAFRLGALLSFGSVILKVESPYYIWIDQFMKPMEHYIPIKRDFSNLEEILKWCHDHDDACKRIGNNCYKLYKKIMNKNFLFEYMKTKINENC